MSFPKTGKLRPAVVVAAALQLSLGEGHIAAKTAAAWGGANERTAKNWIAGRYSPSGEHLINLMKESDEVFEAVAMLAGRHEACMAIKLRKAQVVLLEALHAIDEALGCDSESPADILSRESTTTATV